MKKRYLFPIAFIVLLAVTIIVPALFPLVYLVSTLTMIVVNSISERLGGPVDNSYAIVVATIIQFFLIGYVWDVIGETISGHQSGFEEK